MRHRGQEGFSLLEVLIALGILALAMIGATTSQLIAMKFSSTSRSAVIAMQLAEEQLELLQAMPAADVKVLGSASDPNNPLDPDPNDGVSMAFTRRWIITPDSPEPDVMQLEVQVDWIDGSDSLRTTSLRSLKADL